MKLLKNWKAILVLLLVFLAGGVTGSVVMVVRFKSAFERALTAGNWTAEVMKHMQKELNLTAEQRTRIGAILDETGGQFGATFGLAVRESGTNLVSCWQRIEQELTPEQRVIHRQKCQEFREGLKKALKIELPPEPTAPESPGL